MTKFKGTIYIGIDPGIGGAIAAIHPDGVVQSWHVFKKTTTKTLPRAKTAKGKPKKEVTRQYLFREMYMLLYRFRKLQEKGYRVLVGLEQQHSRPTDSKHTATAVGRNQGVWEALVGAACLEVRLVHPSVWKRRYLEPAAPKQRSLDMCKEIYPQHDLPLKKDEARAEAILIADYCMRDEKNMEYPRVPPPKRRRSRRSGRRGRMSRAIPRG